MSKASGYTKALGDKICAALAAGKSLRSICKGKDMPAASTVCEWAANDKAFGEQYARAREVQAETLADEIVSIADTEKDPQRARVRVDARKWVASKLKPKRFGDKVTQEVSGPDGGAVPLSVTVNFR